jgi:hypothetical protein
MNEHPTRRHFTLIYMGFGKVPRVGACIKERWNWMIGSFPRSGSVQHQVMVQITQKQGTSLRTLFQTVIKIKISIGGNYV